jgi:hypothetical protein
MITFSRLYNKVLSLGKEWYYKCHFFNPLKAVVFTLAPYTKMGNEWKHKEILAYLQRYAGDTLPEGYSMTTKIADDCPIWVYWHQGFNNAPPIIKKAYSNLLKYSGNHKVVALDKDNISEYVHFPAYVYDKVHLGKITLTHFSDLLRMAILSDYGGFWIDSTILLSQPLQHYDTPFYTIRNNRFNPRYVNGGSMWSAFFIATGEKNAVAKYVLDLFLNYWKKEECLIDYFLVDYSIAIAYYKFSEFKDIIDRNPSDNAEVSKMATMLNDEFDSDIWKQLYHSQTIHKLSWKLPLRKGNTIANYIINDL